MSHQEFWASLNRTERRLARKAMITELMSHAIGGTKLQRLAEARKLVDMSIANAKKGLLDGNTESRNT